MTFKKSTPKSKFSIWIVAITILLNFSGFLTPVRTNTYSDHQKVQTECYESRKAAISINKHLLVAVKRNTFTITKEKLNLYKLLAYNTFIKAKLIKFDKKVSCFKIPYTFQNKITSFSDPKPIESLFFHS